MSVSNPIGYKMPRLTHINNPIGQPTFISVTGSPYPSYTSHATVCVLGLGTGGEVTELAYRMFPCKRKHL